ncbi:ferritin-like domain-containing protein [Burkholderia sp. Bp9140]|uniref:ferritin-like domain-containing protein n=1 Tax=Burkholderia sp. Bp9140 TaxID=2184572 RepID=UPI000F571B79|nr:ferritin-like domain-containing protein [Burkholderia sp. Bp9140]RQR53090.1 ferritin-like domain-containing protein [Burkholderia sp. Bp9140]
MANPHAHLEDWLRDAYAMARQAETLLDAQAKRVAHYPQWQDRLRLHLDDTLGQQALVEACLQRLGTTPSAIKDLAGRIAAYRQVAGEMLASDEVVKGAMAVYAFQQVEIAAYTALVEAARATGEEEIRACCARILQQEHDMAAWLLHHLPALTTAFLDRSAVDRIDAKR